MGISESSSAFSQPLPDLDFTFLDGKPTTFTVRVFFVVPASGGWWGAVGQDMGDKLSSSGRIEDK